MPNPLAELLESEGSVALVATLGFDADSLDMEARNNGWGEAHNFSPHLRQAAAEITRLSTLAKDAAQRLREIEAWRDTIRAGVKMLGRDCVLYADDVIAKIDAILERSPLTEEPRL